MYKLRTKHGHPADFHVNKSESPPKSVGIHTINRCTDGCKTWQSGRFPGWEIWESASNFGSQDARNPTYFIHSLTILQTMPFTRANSRTNFHHLAPWPSPSPSDIPPCVLLIGLRCPKIALEFCHELFLNGYV